MIPSERLVARKFTVVVAGQSEDTYAESLAEVSRRINMGYLTGHDSNDESGFYFDSTDDVPTEELPA